MGKYKTVFLRHYKPYLMYKNAVTVLETSQSIKVDGPTPVFMRWFIESRNNRHFQTKVEGVEHQLNLHQ